MNALSLTSRTLRPRIGRLPTGHADCALNMTNAYNREMICTADYGAMLVTLGDDACMRRR